MGLNLNSIKLLFEAKAAGVSFERTLTLGRQAFHCHPAFFHELKTKFGYASSDYSPEKNSDPAYADIFFKMLGAREVVALDHSAYEGAEIIHDLNTPIGEGLRGRFDVVIDGGALEHVFNFPAAIRNCMEMVIPGGHFLAVTPINNFCGHGFYQFTPELFFRTLSPENGFHIERAIAWEERENTDYFQIHDPAVIRRRVELVNTCPVLMFFQAKKIKEISAFNMPQQSDYVALWESSEATRPTPGTENLKGRRSFRTRLVLAFLDWFPHFTTAVFGLRRMRKLKSFSLRQEPGFKPLGKLSSKDSIDRLPSPGGE